MPWTGYARTLKQITDATYRLCGDVSPLGRYGRIWHLNEVVDAINRAVLGAVDYVGGLRASRVIPLTEDVNIYDLPGDCLRLTRVNIHGLEGMVLLPVSITELDLAGTTREATGDPWNFYREFLEPDQIGVLPIPFQDGSSFTRDHTHGQLRQVKDADGVLLPYDANAALRRVRGVPFQRTGDGRIVREIISPYGNLQVSYIKSPIMMDAGEDYPDPGVPEWIHKDIKYGAAVSLLRPRRNKLDQIRCKRFDRKWLKALMRWQKLIEHQGPMASSVTPM
jgi:hypothetical protein